MPSSSRTSQPTHPGRRRVRRGFIVLDVLLVVLVAGTGIVYGYAHYRLSQIHRIPLASAPAGSKDAAETPLTDETPGQPFNLVLVGSDSRAFATTKQQQAQYGNPNDVGGQRSDTLMVIHFDPAARTARVMSIHRDLYVPIAGTKGWAKINSALDNGPAALLKTLRNNLGISAAHYAQVDFVGFQKVVDALGPVPFYFPTPVRDPNTGLNVTASGCANLNGTQALALVRSRHLQYQQDGKWRDDVTDDRGRIVRQQDFMRRVVQLALSKGLDSPTNLNSLVGALAPNLTVDSGFSAVEMARVGRRFASVGVNAVQWTVLPVLDAQADGQDVEKLDEPTADAVLASFGGRAQGELATRSFSSRSSGTATNLAHQTPAVRLASLGGSASIRVVGNGASPEPAVQAQADLLAAGVEATVAFTADPPPTNPRIVAPPALRTSAANLAGLIPGATASTDSALKGTTLVLFVSSQWRGFAGGATGTTAGPSSSTTTTLPALPTTTTVPAKGTDDQVAC